MNCEEMREVLNELNVPVRNYSINDSLGSDKCIFRQVYNYWECFYFDEKGNENEYKRFDDEDSACKYFLKCSEYDIKRI